MGLFNLMKRGGNGIWTASDYSDEAYNNLPRIELYEYTQTYSQILQSIGYWIRKIEEGLSNPYEGLYHGTPTGNVYVLPFFSPYNHVIGQKWQENTGALGDMVKQGLDFVETVAKVFAPTAGILYPKSWAGSDETSYEFSFDLLNTVHENDYMRNRLFLGELIKQNLHFQQNVLTITPPSIYEVMIPGIRWSPVSVISNLTVTNKGTLTRSPEGFIIPDAWGVSIQIRELINESQNLLQLGWPGLGTQAGTLAASVNPETGVETRGITVRAIDTRSVVEPVAEKTDRVLKALIEFPGKAANMVKEGLGIG